MSEHTFFKPRADSFASWNWFCITFSPYLSPRFYIWLSLLTGVSSPSLDWTRRQIGLHLRRCWIAISLKLQPFVSLASQSETRESPSGIPTISHRISTTHTIMRIAENNNNFIIARACYGFNTHCFPQVWKLLRKVSHILRHVPIIDDVLSQVARMSQYVRGGVVNLKN